MRGGDRSVTRYVGRIKGEMSSFIKGVMEVEVRESYIQHVRESKF